MRKFLFGLMASLLVCFIILCGLKNSRNVSVASLGASTKHCTYTVGCNCPSFAPKTDGEVWEQAYCKRCGHHKKYHK